MSVVSNTSRYLLMLGALALPATGTVAAQAQYPGEADLSTTVYAATPPPASEMDAGPEIDGFISARSGDKMQVTTPDGAQTVVAITDDTQIKASGGFLGLNRDTLAATQLMNGLPVSVETLAWEGGLVASKVDLKSKDLKTAAMIHNGTDQRFAQQTAATEALRGRMGDIDQYNIKQTTSVNFDTGKYALSTEAKDALCATASQAEGMDNALLLVVGYTDSTGSQEYNQMLSEKRAGRVVNYLQQACGWKPYRMLTPTGMAEADPVADNSSRDGKAQNRRVAVNVLVSKGLDGL
ncbi:cell envelope biogenesis protein OmpA [Novosphingobium sp. PC22D]|uniref:OmpA family protein n=1 Tax=Novosphingobium sp. PC22D TaxID=1962403 RepID=UPI000BF00470|nr:OmpA family protein [Novosphingobium sp. PC22D]PEQ13240.1 cell envelope biogenesis protein OmpA [Novosphingobium sp. PC22D]